MDIDAEIAKEANRQAAEAGTTIDAGNNSADNSNASGEANNASSESTDNNGSANQSNENAAGADASGEANQNTNTNNAGAESTPLPLLAELDRLSGGTIKSMDDLTNALAKVKEVDALTLQVKDYEAKAVLSPFADEYEQKRNELKKSGATKDVLKAFEAINDLGSLADIDPKEALINKMILVDKVGEKVARLKVNKMFDMENLEGDDLEIMESDLALAGKDASKELEKFRAAISVPNSDKVILDAAGKAQLQSQLKPTLTQISTNLNTFASVSIEGKEGEQAVTVDLGLSTDDKAFITSTIEEIMISENLPMTQENLNYAIKEAKRDYLEKNVDNMISATWEKAKTHFTKLFSEKYENTGGLPKGDNKGKSDASALSAETKAFEDELLGNYH